MSRRLTAAFGCLVLALVLRAAEAAGQSTPSATPERIAPVATPDATAAPTPAVGQVAHEAGTVDPADSSRATFRSPEAESYFELGLAEKARPRRKFDAIRAFRRAFRADPTALGALYEFADTYLLLDGWEGQDQARRALVAILEQDPFYLDAYERWQSLWLYAGEHRRVARAFRRQLQRAFSAPLAARAADLYVQVRDRNELADLLGDWRRSETPPSSPYWYYRARLLFLEGKDSEATESFLTGLERVSTEADLDPFWRDLLPLLNDRDRELAELRTLGGRLAFVRAFWESRDPLPFSPANERLADHYRRVSEVRRRYLWKKPLAKEKVLGDRLDDMGRPSFDTRLEGRSVDDRGTVYLLHGEPDERFIEVGGSEYWRYVRPELPGGRLQYHFRLMEGPMARGNDVVFSLAPTTDMGVANTRAGDAGEADFVASLWALGTDSYRPAATQPSFPLALTHATFRNLENPARTDLLLAVAMPLDSLRALERSDAVELVQHLKVYDGEYRTELVQHDTLSVGGSTDGAAALVGAFRLVSVAGERRYALQVDAVRSGARVVTRGELPVPSYASRELQLSDVVFATRVGPASSDPRAYSRAGFAIRPLLNPGLNRTHPLHLYYEVYDPPVAEDGRVRYRVQYRVSADGPVARGLLARIFGGSDAIETGSDVTLAFEKEQPGSVERIPETISLDLSQLPPGRYRIEVAVQDLATRAEVSRVVVLELLDDEAGS